MKEEFLGGRFCAAYLCNEDATQEDRRFSLERGRHEVVPVCAKHSNEDEE